MKSKSWKDLIALSSNENENNGIVSLDQYSLCLYDSYEIDLGIPVISNRNQYLPPSYHQTKAALTNSSILDNIYDNEPKREK